MYMFKQRFFPSTICFGYQEMHIDDMEVCTSLSGSQNVHLMRKTSDVKCQKLHHVMNQDSTDESIKHYEGIALKFL